MSLSSTTSHPPSATPPAKLAPSDHHEPTEPFGQTGVRQYFGRMLTWVCIAICICSLGMWYRSQSFFDSLTWGSQGQTYAISSAFGRLQLRAETASTRRMGYSGGYLQRRTRDAWEPSIWKSIGIELGHTPIDPRSTRSTWLRIKWYWVAVVFGVLPILRWLFVWRRQAWDDTE